MSDAFIDKSKKPQLELTVRILNINKNHNKDILNKSKTLNDYSTFINEIREKYRFYFLLRASKASPYIAKINSRAFELIFYLSLIANYQRALPALRKILAKSLLDQGVSEEVILKVTGLSREEIVGNGH